MIERIPFALYPVMALQDRYGGTYSGGPWIAVREANQLVEAMSRAAWVVERGPSGDDREAAAFWSEAPDWVASGASPEEAIRALIGKG